MALLPIEIPTGTVHGQFYFVSEDSVDGSTDPDLQVVSGVVNFVASAPVLYMAEESAVVVPLTFKGKFNSQGELVPLNGEGVGIELPATNSDKISPVGYTWRVVFDIRNTTTNFTVPIPSFNMQLSEGEIVDLATIMPVAESQGVLTVRGPAGPQGPIGPPGIADDVGVAAVIADPDSLTNIELAARYASLFGIDGGNP